MIQKVRWFLVICGVLLALVFALWNNNSVTVKFPFFQREIPLSLLILTSIAIGFLLGAMMTYSMLRPRKKVESKPKTASQSPDVVDELAPQDAKTK